MRPRFDWGNELKESKKKYEGTAMDKGEELCPKCNEYLLPIILVPEYHCERRAPPARWLLRDRLLTEGAENAKRI